jgi:hypothetical protein
MDTEWYLIGQTVILDHYTPTMLMELDHTKGTFKLSIKTLLFFFQTPHLMYKDHGHGLLELQCAVISPRDPMTSLEID